MAYGLAIRLLLGLNRKIDSSVYWWYSISPFRISRLRRQHEDTGEGSLKDTWLEVFICCLFVVVSFLLLFLFLVFTRNLALLIVGCFARDINALSLVDINKPFFVVLFLVIIHVPGGSVSIFFLSLQKKIFCSLKLLPNYLGRRILLQNVYSIFMCRMGLLR